MVNRREAELARACRMLLDAYKRGEGCGFIDWENIDQAHRAAVDALKIKTSYGRRRAAIVVKNGCALLDWADRGVIVTIKDEDAGRVFKLNEPPSAERRRARAKATRKRRGRPKVPASWPVQPLKPGELAEDRAECGDCGRAWDDGKVTSMTPAPAGRCPFENWH